MIKISLKNIELSELAVIQEELQNFISYKNQQIFFLKNSPAYFEQIMLLDIGQRMYYSFRAKIENCTKTTASLLKMKLFGWLLPHIFHHK
jgi:hypothetical protein